MFVIKNRKIPFFPNVHVSDELILFHCLAHLHLYIYFVNPLTGEIIEIGRHQLRNCVPSEIYM